MNDPAYFTLAKSIHMITVAITITGFLVRGYWMFRDSPLLKARLTRILPHVNDTVLFCSAIWTGSLIGQYPFVSGWLTAKVIGLLGYIVLGALALTYGRTRTIRTYAFIGALICFAYVVAVAATKNPFII